MILLNSLYLLTKHQSDDKKTSLLCHEFFRKKLLPVMTFEMQTENSTPATNIMLWVSLMSQHLM